MDLIDGRRAAVQRGKQLFCAGKNLKGTGDIEDLGPRRSEDDYLSASPLNTMRIVRSRQLLIFMVTLKVH